MTHSEVLTKAIKLANERGWSGPITRFSFDLPAAGEQQAKVDYIEPFIFDHGFAKAIWGSDEQSCLLDYTEDHMHCCNDLVEWQYHLQQMVLSKDPIEYLGENLD